MIILSVDGASRRNGKPDCLSAGAVFMMDTETNQTALEFVHEFNSTNQRGEISALLAALKEGLKYEDVYLITDSEYMFGTVAKEWYKSWRSKGWVTSSNAPVKNQDLWETAGVLLDKYHTESIEHVMYCIKGHLLKMGKVAALRLIESDFSGVLLYKALTAVYHQTEIPQMYKDKFAEVNGFMPPEDVFRNIVVCNMVSDLAAGYYIDSINSSLQ